MKIFDYSTREDIDSIRVVIREDSLLAQKIEDPNGSQIICLLDYGHRYTVIIGAPGYSSKSYIIDTRNIGGDDRLGGFTIESELTLFRWFSHLDYTVFSQPVAKCKFDPHSSTLMWDIAYTRERQSEFDEFIKQYEEEVKDGY